MSDAAGPAPASSSKAEDDPAPWGLSGALALPLAAYAAQAGLALLLAQISRRVLVAIEPNIAHEPEKLREMSLVVSVLPLALAWTMLALALLYVSVTVLHRRPLLSALRLIPPERGPLIGSVMLGVAVAGGYVALALAFPPGEDVDLGGPLSRLAEAGPVAHALLLVLALVMAPIVEEMLFRGYVFLGARRRLGTAGSGVLVTIAFTALHAGETGTYWPALAGIGTMAVALVVLMHRSGNLTYCVAAHLGYNATLAALSLMGAE